MNVSSEQLTDSVWNYVHHLQRTGINDPVRSVVGLSTYNIVEDETSCSLDGQEYLIWEAIYDWLIKDYESI